MLHGSCRWPPKSVMVMHRTALQEVAADGAGGINVQSGDSRTRPAATFHDQKGSSNGCPLAGPHCKKSVKGHYFLWSVVLSEYLQTGCSPCTPQCSISCFQQPGPSLSDPPVVVWIITVAILNAAKELGESCLRDPECLHQATSLSK